MSHAAPPVADDEPVIRAPRPPRRFWRRVTRALTWVAVIAVLLAAGGWYVAATHPGLREGSLKGGTTSGALVTSNLGFDRAYVVGARTATVSYSIRNSGVFPVTIDGLHTPTTPGFPETVISAMDFALPPDAQGLPQNPVSSLTLDPDSQVLVTLTVDLSVLRPAPACGWSRVQGVDLDVTTLGLSTVTRVDLAIPFQWRGFVANGEGDPGCSG